MSTPEPEIRQAISIDLGDDGVAATHPVTIDFPRRVAPAFKSDPKHNTIKPFLIVVGCCSLPHTQFDFDSSFVLPSARSSFARLAKLRDDLTEVDDVPAPGAPAARRVPTLSIFGHADPVGDPHYNSRLSARRAEAVYGMLIQDPAIWERLIASPLGGDRWGPNQFAIMENEVGKQPTRRALILAYMKAVCVRIDATGTQVQEFKLDRGADFLGGAGDSGGKANVQGCGEFNPTFIMSKDQERELDRQDPSHELRNAANRVNRRVIAFLFKPGSHIRPARWPCPSVRNLDPFAVCQDRLWSDAKRRMDPKQDKDRQFKETQDTFGCRFYHGIASNSPCEGIRKQWVVRVLLQPPKLTEEPVPLRNRNFVVTAGDAPDAPLVRGKTDLEGIFRLPVFDEHATMKLKLEVGEFLVPQGPSQRPAKPTPEDEEGFAEFELAAGELRLLGDGALPDEPGRGSPALEKLAVKQRLFNLGFGRDELDKWTEEDFSLAVRRFQERENLPRKDGVVDQDTKDRLALEHEPRRIRAGIEADDRSKSARGR